MRIENIYTPYERDIITGLATLLKIPFTVTESYKEPFHVFNIDLDVKPRHKETLQTLISKALIIANEI